MSERLVHTTSGFSGADDAIIELAIKHWAELAEEQRRLKAYEESQGRLAPAHAARIESYDATVKALRLEQQTGVPHCSCCLKPMAAKGRS